LCLLYSASTLVGRSCLFSSDACDSCDVSDDSDACDVSDYCDVSEACDSCYVSDAYMSLMSVMPVKPVIPVMPVMPVKAVMSVMSVIPRLCSWLMICQKATIIWLIDQLSGELKTQLIRLSIIRLLILWTC